jgi:hypothetical protein
LAVIVAVLIGSVTVFLWWSARQATRMHNFFISAVASYLIFEDIAAGSAALLAAVTAVGPTRDKMIAVLRTLATAPDTLSLLLITADSTGRSGLQTQPLHEVGEKMRGRAAELADRIVAFDGDLLSLRQSLFHMAPNYELALGGMTETNLDVFPCLNPVAIQQLRRMFS